MNFQKCRNQYGIISFSTGKLQNFVTEPIEEFLCPYLKQNKIHFACQYNLELEIYRFTVEYVQ